MAVLNDTGFSVHSVVQVELLVTEQQERVTAPSWEEALSVLELLVTRLHLLDTETKEKVHTHLQVMHTLHNLSILV